MLTREFCERKFDFFGDLNRTEYTYDNKKHRLEEDWKHIYVYDLNGNLISRQEKQFAGKVQNFVYSSENQLVSIEWFENNSSVKKVEYSYDALGRRVVKKVRDGTGAVTLLRKYVYDGQEVIAELDEDDNTLVRYTHSGMRTDDVLSMDVTSHGVSRGIAQAAGSYFFHKDGLGSIIEITNSSGNIIQHYVYSSFGKILKIVNGSVDNTQNPLIKTNFAYTNREYDSESGLYYYRARYYAPDLGRFLTEDPHPGYLSVPSTFNSSYTYVLNNPINFKDPKGKIAPIVVAMIVGAAVNLSAHLLSGKTLTLGSVLQSAAVGAIAGGVGYGVGSLIGGGFIGAGLGGFAGGFSGSMANTFFSGEDPFSAKGIIKATISGAFGFAAGVVGYNIFKGISQWYGSNSQAAATAGDYSAGVGASAGEAVVDEAIDQVFIAVPIHH